jgi:DNA invertase Pin-like site-specific DNA recombinase
MSTAPKTIPCAIYTRKSNAEGLDMEFNSLDAQREAGEAFIASQRGEGLVAMPEHYDDGGFSGGNVERPALQRLLADVKAGRIGAVITYKVDRLSRSLLDFAKLMEVFEQHGVSFISVTQQFNSATSMGRLTLNVLLSFAQFEREVIGERIRDKIAMQKAKGKNCGGVPPLGYDIADHKLIVNHAEAETVRHIFQRFTQLGSATQLVRELKNDGLRTKSWTTVKGKTREGRPFDKLQLYRLLQNRKYIGEVTHGDKIYPGEHDAIIEHALWEKTQAIFSANRRIRANATRTETPGVLKGVLKCGHCGATMILTYTRKKARTYRYYVCATAHKNGHDACPVKTASAGDIEEAVAERVRAVLRDPEHIAAALRLIEAEETTFEPRELASAVRNVEATWDALFPVEQARIVRLLIANVVLHPDGIEINFADGGIRALANEALPERKAT